MGALHEFQSFGGAFQFAYVAHDVKSAAALFGRRFGVTEFRIHDVSVDCHGGSGKCVTRVGIAWLGDRQIELIEPVSGEVACYVAALPTDRDAVSFHHIGVRVRGDLNDWSRTRDALLSGGASIALEGGLEDRLRFAYVNTRGSLGHYIEYIWLGRPFLSAEAAQ